MTAPQSGGSAAYTSLPLASTPQAFRLRQLQLASIIPLGLLFPNAVGLGFSVNGGRPPRSEAAANRRMAAAEAKRARRAEKRAALLKKVKRAAEGEE